MAAVSAGRGSAAPAPDPSAEWDEARVISSLDQLQNMHIQLRQLRETMPRLVEPLLTQHASPEELYTNYSTSTLETAKAIKSLTKFMQEAASQDMLKRARSSGATDAEDIRPWMVTEHVDWLEVRNLGAHANGDGKDETQQHIEAASFPTPQDLSVSLDKFRAAHPGIVVQDLDNNRKTFEVYLPSPSHIHFQIEPYFSSSSFQINTTEKSKLHSLILSAVNTRPNPQSIDDLLGMLASYSDIRSRPCVKCGRLLDRDAQFPSGRHLKRWKENDRNSTREWQPQHSGCS